MNQNGYTIIELIIGVIFLVGLGIGVSLGWAMVHFIVKVW